MKRRLGIFELMAIIVALISSGVYAQYFGHEYEGTQAPIREGEQSVIPLDTKDPSYNVWRTPRDDLQAGREPGEFNPSRFPFGASWQDAHLFQSADCANARGSEGC